MIFAFNKRIKQNQIYFYFLIDFLKMVFNIDFNECWKVGLTEKLYCRE